MPSLWRHRIHNTMKNSKHLLSTIVAASLLTTLLSPGDAAPAASTLHRERYVWRNVAIVAGGFIPGIVFHPKVRDVAYARTDIGGAYRWDAPAQRWIPITDVFGPDDWNLLGIESIALDPADANRVYLAAGTYTNNWAGNGAILRSTDQGRTWARTDLPFKNGGNEDGRSMGERLAVHPKRSNVLFFGTRRNGLWKSSDSGATFAKVASFPAPENKSGVGIGFVVFAPNGDIYAGVADKDTNLYRSKDDGATWQVVTGGPQGWYPHHGVFDASGTLYLSYGNGPGPNGMSDGGVWKFDSGAQKWTDITPVKPNQNGAPGFGYAGLTLDAQHPGTVMAATMDRWNGGDDIFRSTDGGATWKSVRDKSARDASLSPYLSFGGKDVAFGHWIGDVEIDPFNSNRAVYGTGATMWGTDDLNAVDAGQTTHWTVFGAGIEETAVLDLISPPTGAPLVSAQGDIGVYRHDDLTISPRAGMATNPTFSSANGLDFAANAPLVLVRVGHAGRNERNGALSKDGGATWTSFGSEPQNSRGGGSVALSADGQIIVWTPEGAVPHVSRDGGATWMPCGGLHGGLAVIADRVNANTFYAVDGENLLASTDGGATFAPRGKVPSGGKLSAVPERAGDLWLAAGGNGLHHSMDGGATWMKLPTVQSADGVGFGKAAPGADYPAIFLSGRAADGKAGICRSDDGGTTWVRVNDDAHQWGNAGHVLTGDPRVYGRVYVDTNGRGIQWGEMVARSEVP